MVAARYLDAEEGQETSVDAIGGASAGALVSFFTAHALLEGLDPEALLHETWVERVSVAAARQDSKALLSFDQLRERVPEVLAPDGPRAPTPAASTIARAARSRCTCSSPACEGSRIRFVACDATRQ